MRLTPVVLWVNSTLIQNPEHDHLLRLLRLLLHHLIHQKHQKSSLKQSLLRAQFLRKVVDNWPASNLFCFVTNFNQK